MVEVSDETPMRLDVLKLVRDDLTNLINFLKLSRKKAYMYAEFLSKDQTQKQGDN